MSLDAATVLDAAAGGIYVPEDAMRVDADGYVMVRYSFDFAFPTSVLASQASGEGDEVLVYADGRPAAYGGCGYEDGVARLYGGSTMPALRGRGAHRASLEARLEAAAQAGCWLALVKGRVGTSAPILRRAGFVEYGQERVHRMAVPEV